MEVEVQAWLRIKDKSLQKKPPQRSTSSKLLFCWPKVSSPPKESCSEHVDNAQKEAVHHAIPALQTIMLHAARHGMVLSPRSAECLSHAVTPTRPVLGVSASVPGYGQAVRNVVIQRQTLASYLHRSVRSGCAEAVQSALEAAADPSGKDEFGWTALHVAAHQGSFEICSLLLERRADPLASASVSVWDKQSFTPLSLSKKSLDRCYDRGLFCGDKNKRRQLELVVELLEEGYARSACNDVALVDLS